MNLHKIFEEAGWMEHPYCRHLVKINNWIFDYVPRSAGGTM